MKHVLISCDSCGKMVPEDSLAGWWGASDPKDALPTFQFAPLTVKTVDGFKRHICEDPECLQSTMRALATSVNMDLVAKAAAKPAANPTISLLDLMFGGRRPYFENQGPSLGDDPKDAN